MADAMELQTKSQEPHSARANLYLSSQIVLRALVISSTLAATWILLTAKQSLLILGIPFDARYTYSSAFKFFGLANAIACGFCLLSVCFVLISTRQLALGNRQRIFLFFVHDLLMMGLVLSGCAAASAIGFVGKYGNSHAGWAPICDHFGKFCNRITISVAISYFGVLCLLVLTIISANPTKLHA